MAQAINGLDSARLKLIRANEHFDAIKAYIAAYRSGKPYDILMQSDGTEKVVIFEEPSPIISILAGEIVYQIRSALDHLVFELVKSNPSGIVLPTRWTERCQFPIFLNLPKGVSGTPVPKSYFLSKLPGISEAAYTFIELLQPYYRGNAFGFLQILRGLSNIDKHRRLNVTIATVGRHEVVTGKEGQPIRISVQAGMRDGTEVESPASSLMPNGIMDVKRSTFVSVVFSEPSAHFPGSYLPVQDGLESLIRELGRGVIPVFESLLKVP